MPATKRSRETTTPPPSPSPPLELGKADDSLQCGQNHSREEADFGESSYSSGGETSEFILVKLAEIRKEVQCPICLGIIRKTRTVMECLHRFCRECIDKSMRLGNNECPACRTHCASRRSLRDDPNYDALIAALYPDIDKYEEEELAFHEEEKARYKQIQASIAQTFHRQAEALGKKRTSANTKSVTFVRRQGNNRNSRGRRNNHVEEEGENGHEDSKGSSSGDEHSAEVKCKTYRRRNSQPSSGTNGNGGCDDNGSELLGALFGSREFIAWGRGGMRSSTRHGGAHHWSNGRVSSNSRLSKLIDRLQSSHENDDTLNISLMLVSLDEEKIPSLKRPYLCCCPTSSVRHLCQYVAGQTSVEDSQIEMLLIKDLHHVKNSSVFLKEPSFLNPCQNELHLLNQHQTLEEICANHTQQNLVLAYRERAQSGEN